MLQPLRVTDYILFGRVDIEFGSRLNVISGETGAGKSILFGALELLLGGEAAVRQIREGASRAVVEGLFRIDKNVFYRMWIEVSRKAGTKITPQVLRKWQSTNLGENGVQIDMLTYFGAEH